MRIKLFEGFNKDDYYVTIKGEEYNNNYKNEPEDFTSREIEMINSLNNTVKQKGKGSISKNRC
jgi:hypothetical protein